MQRAAEVRESLVSALIDYPRRKMEVRTRQAELLTIPGKMKAQLEASFRSSSYAAYPTVSFTTYF